MEVHFVVVRRRESIVGRRIQVAVELYLKGATREDPSSWTVSGAENTEGLMMDGTHTRVPVLLLLPRTETLEPQGTSSRIARVAAVA